ncbi:MAG: hypothetical protein SGI90_15045 [Candidatus Eisenbacteria bacterium]|nr:hypothetical protein [Candidatus Eisenbacteria bacterium]
MLLLGLDGTALVAEVKASPTFSAGTPRVLSKRRPDAVTVTASADFQRFLGSIPTGASTPPSLVLELNWTSALKR